MLCFKVAGGLPTPAMRVPVMKDAHLLVARARPAARHEDDAGLEALGLVNSHDLYGAPLALQALDVALEVERQPRLVDEPRQRVDEIAQRGPSPPACSRSSSKT